MRFSEDMGKEQRKDRGGKVLLSVQSLWVESRWFMIGIEEAQRKTKRFMGQNKLTF